MTKLLSPRLRFWSLACLAAFIADIISYSVDNVLDLNQFDWTSITSRYPVADSPRGIVELLLFIAFGGFIVSMGNTFYKVDTKGLRRLLFSLNLVLAPVMWEMGTEIVTVFFRVPGTDGTGGVVALAEFADAMYLRFLEPNRFLVIGAIVYGLMINFAGMLIGRYTVNASGTPSPELITVKMPHWVRLLRKYLPSSFHHIIPIFYPPVRVRS